MWGPTFFNERKHAPNPYTVRLFEPGNLPKPLLPPAQKASKREVHKKKVTSPVKKKKSTITRRKKADGPKPMKVRKEALVKRKAVSLSPKRHRKAEREKKEKKRSAKSKARAGLKEKKVAEKIREIQKRLREKSEEDYLKKRLQEIVAQQKKHQGERPAREPSGPAGVQNRQEMIYGNFVKAKIWHNWHFPKALADRKGLVAVVTITITKDGRILEIRVKKYSGLSAFDRSVLNAIRDSAPLPPFPPSFHRDVDEIDIRFDLSMAKGG